MEAVIDDRDPVSRIRAKYFSTERFLVISNQRWTLTVKVISRRHLSSVLSNHGFRLRDSHWDNTSTGILAADLVRRA